MSDQWNELKATITELRDNGGTGTQQEVCKFLVNMMDALERQMQEPEPICVAKVTLTDEQVKEAVEKAKCEILTVLSAEPEITLEDIKKYCKKRGLVILTSEFYNEMKSRLSSAQQEVKKNVLYPDCANAMLMMWMDEVLTDDEYNRIMDKLNEYEKKNGNAMQG